MAGFPAVIEEPDEPPFHSDWEAHVFALNGALIKRRCLQPRRVPGRQERLPVQEYLAASYYERWFARDHHAAAGRRASSRAEELELPIEH